LRINKKDFKFQKDCNYFEGMPGSDYCSRPERHDPRDSSLSGSLQKEQNGRRKPISFAQTIRFIKSFLLKIKLKTSQPGWQPF
jgi:hypothetical protein